MNPIHPYNVLVRKIIIHYDRISSLRNIRRNQDDLNQMLSKNCGGIE